MNKMRRKELGRAADMLREAYDIIQCCRDEEEEAYDNLPESFQDGEKGEEMQDYMLRMDEAMDSIEEAADTIEEIAGV